jgi:hypothetical protein
MQVHQQFRWFPGQVVTLILALFAAAVLGGSAGYQLRDHGFPSLNATTHAPAAKAPYAKPAYVEPDAVDRGIAQASPSTTHATTHGLLP